MSTLNRRSRGRSLLLPLVLLAAVAAVVYFVFYDVAPSGDDDPGALQSPVAQTGDGPGMELDPAGDRGATGPGLEPERLPTPERDPAAAESGESGYEVAVLGRVVDAQDNGLADIDVSLYDALGDFLDVTTSEADGSFVFESDEALAAQFVVSSDPDPFSDSEDPDATAPALYRHAETWRPGDAPVEVELVVDTAPRIEGRVSLASTGEAVFLADIEIVVGGAAFVDDYQDEWTDEQGNFSISLVDVPPKGILVRVTDDEAVAIEGPFDMKPGQRLWLDIELEDPVTLRGLVFDADTGEPLPDVEVNVLPLHPVFDTSNDWDVTFDDGSFELEDVAMPADRIWLVASDMEHGPELVQVTRPDLPVEIRLGPLVNLSGKVVDANSGEPVEDYEVRVVLLGPVGANDDYEDLGWPEGDGAFDFDLEMVPVQAALLIVEAPGYITVRAPLGEYAPLGKGWVEYEFDVPLQPAGG